MVKTITETDKRISLHVEDLTLVLLYTNIECTFAFDIKPFLNLI